MMCIGPKVMFIPMIMSQKLIVDLLAEHLAKTFGHQ
jgi:hypothetical protein